jgi:hypothetical protein
MKTDEQECLLDEIVTGVDLDEFRADSLRTALGSMRRARRGRKIRTGLAASIPVVLTVLLLVMRNGDSLSDNVDAGSRANRNFVSGPVSGRVGQRGWGRTDGVAGPGNLTRRTSVRFEDSE